MPGVVRGWRIHAEGQARSLLLGSCAERPPGPREVVVRVGAVALNFRDLLMLSGRAGGQPPSARVPCSDAAGEVVQTGDEVTSVRPGDRVITTFVPAWTSGPLTPDAASSILGGAHTDGVLAEQVVLPERAVIRAPAALDLLEACTLPCAALTAWHALFEEAPLPADATVLAIGSGGVAVFAMQFARRLGRRVLAVTRHAEKRERLEQLGAEATVDSLATPAWGEVVRSLAGDGVSHVIEVGGSGTLVQSIRAARYGGTISLIGSLARPMPVDLNSAVSRNLRIQGIVAGSREMLSRMLATFEEGVLRPVVDRVFPFAEAPAAFHHLAQGRHIGKVVVDIGS